MKRNPKVIIVMPAYNAEKTLAKTVREIKSEYSPQIILVDDNSHDRTVKLAKKFGLKTYIHSQNRGYGGNQKSCYTLAINDGANVVVMIHPDYQYDASLTDELVRPILEKRFDVILGSRIRTRNQVLAGGMPRYKYTGNRLLTIIENIVLGQNLSEYHTGFRAFDVQVLKRLPYHKFSDDFVFDQEILISAIEAGYEIGETHVPVRYFEEASSINFKRSVKYGVETLLCLLKFMGRRFLGINFKIFKSK